MTDQNMSHNPGVEANMTAKVLETQRGGVHYWISRSDNENAAELVFLHGLTADHTLFDKQAEFFAASHNLLIWDAPAHGLSRPYADFSYAHCAEDLKAILDEEGFCSPVLIGQSMGGWHAQEFMLRYPGSARGFISIDSSPYDKRYYSRLDLWLLDHMEWMSHFYPYRMLLASISQSAAITPYGQANMRAAIARYSKDELCRLMGLGYRAFVAEHRDIAIPCPMLLLLGKYDKLGNMADYNKVWREHSKALLIIVDMAGHNANADAPETVNSLIADFVASLPPSDRQERAGE